MEVTGEAMTDRLLILEDVKMRRFTTKEGMEWCVKSYQLLKGTDEKGSVLEGTWQGKTSFSSCIPGKLSLRRTVDRA